MTGKGEGGLGKENLIGRDQFFHTCGCGNGTYFFYKSIYNSTGFFN